MTDTEGQKTEQKPPQAGGNQSQEDGSGTQPQAGGSSSGNGSSADAEKREKELTETRREAQNLRARLRELEEANKKYEDANKSELEKAQAQAAEATKRIQSLEKIAREAALESGIARVQGKLGIVSVVAVAKMLKDDIEYDDEGRPRDLEAKVADLVKEMPFLVNGGSGSAAPKGNPGNPPRSGSGTSPLTMDDLRNMTVEEARKRQSEIDAALNAQRRPRC
jgi:hypothetical protein